MLRITNIHAYVEDKHVVKGVDLKIGAGETHAIMGPNGSGKSSLAYVLMGHPSYKVKSQKSKVKSKILLDKQNLLDMTPDERARAGLFLAFQQPITVPGVDVANFLRVAKNSVERQAGNKFSKGKVRKDIAEFNRELEKIAQNLEIKASFLRRSLNEGFSGGEKKKLEMLQLTVLKPGYAVIDEIDTGLDVDALKIVARGIKQVVKSYRTGVLLITHYRRILRLVKPDMVHVMIDGKIVRSGSYELAAEVEEKGYKIFRNNGQAN